MPLERWGGLYVFNTSLGHDVGIADQVYERWGTAVDGPGVDAGGQYLNVKVDGTYFINFTASVTCDTGSTVIFTIYVNDTPLPLGAEVTIDDAGEVKQVSIIGAQFLRAGDNVAVFMRADGERTLTMRFGQFGIMSM